MIAIARNFHSVNNVLDWERPGVDVDQRPSVKEREKEFVIKIGII